MTTGPSYYPKSLLCTGLRFTFVLEAHLSHIQTALGSQIRDMREVGGHRDPTSSWKVFWSQGDMSGHRVSFAATVEAIV